MKELLATATCALLVTSSNSFAEDVHPVGDWDFSSALLFYNETDRVQAIEGVFNANKQLDTDESINFKLTLDSLTGASASGAVPSTQPQTFTRPSGEGSYVIDAGDIPLDDTFLDTREALAFTWSRPAFWDTQSELGLSVSNEFDYLSLGTSASFAKDFNENNTTLNAGLSLGYDIIEPEGGVPVPFALVLPAGETPIRQSDDEDKTLIDIIAGVTQVIDENSLFQINYSFSRSDGYLTDPYKFISVVDPITGAPIFANEREPNLPSVVFENRPDSRTKHSIYGQYKRFFQSSSDVLDTSYRFLVDTFGIRSHTVDLKYRKSLSNGNFIQPRFRWYEQNAADFYTPFLVSGDEPLSGDSASLGSADYRLGEFTGYTLGLEYGQVNRYNSWSVALEYYLQSGDEPENSFGELEELELYPDVDAVFVRLLYDF